MVSLESLICSILFSVLHLMIELVFLKFEASSVSTSFLTYLVICFNAREEWVPF